MQTAFSFYNGHGTGYDPQRPCRDTETRDETLPSNMDGGLENSPGSTEAIVCGVPLDNIVPISEGDTVELRAVILVT